MRSASSLPASTPCKREGIEIALGFTANVNVELALATLQETVTVSGESPIIDTTATRIQQNFKLEQLQSIPNGRDMWALLAVTPSVQMGRIDVGGNRAGTQTGYSAYGQQRPGARADRRHQHDRRHRRRRLLLRLRVARRGVPRHERPVAPRCRTPACSPSSSRRSGSNQFQGEYHVDWYNNAMQGSNIPDEYTAPTAFNNAPIRAHSNEIDRYYDHDINVGGPIAQGQAVVLRHLSQAVQRRGAAELPVRQDLRHQAVERGRQGHLSDQPEEQADRLLPVGPEEAAEPPAVRRPTPIVSPEQTLQAGLGQLGLQG